MSDPNSDALPLGYTPLHYPAEKRGGWIKRRKWDLNPRHVEQKKKVNNLFSSKPYIQLSLYTAFQKNIVLPGLKRIKTPTLVCRKLKNSLLLIGVKEKIYRPKKAVSLFIFSNSFCKGATQVPQYAFFYLSIVSISIRTVSIPGAFHSPLPQPDLSYPT